MNIGRKRLAMEVRSLEKKKKSRLASHSQIEVAELVRSACTQASQRTLRRDFGSKVDF